MGIFERSGFQAEATEQCKGPGRSMWNVEYGKEAKWDSKEVRGKVQRDRR